MFSLGTPDVYSLAGRAPLHSLYVVGSDARGFLPIPLPGMFLVGVGDRFGRSSSAVLKLESREGRDTLEIGFPYPKNKPSGLC